MKKTGSVFSKLAGVTLAVVAVFGLTGQASAAGIDKDRAKAFSKGFNEGLYGTWNSIKSWFKSWF